MAVGRVVREWVKSKQLPPTIEVMKRIAARTSGSSKKGGET